MARPSKRTPELVSKLEYAFSIGATVKEACLYADISRDTYYKWCEGDSRFSDRMEQLQEHTIFVARESVYKGMKRDPKLALDYLKSKKRDEFGNNSTEINIHMPQPILGSQSRKVIDVSTDDSNSQAVITDQAN